VLGCNLAWGIIDGGFYLLGTIFNRNRRISFVRKLKDAANEAEALKLVREEFDLDDEPAMSPDDQADFHADLLVMLRNANSARARLRRRDYVAALLIIALVTATAIPGLILRRLACCSPLATAGRVLQRPIHGIPGWSSPSLACC
jgi:hypothetical protein